MTYYIRPDYDYLIYRISDSEIQFYNPAIEEWVKYPAPIPDVSKLTITSLYNLSEEVRGFYLTYGNGKNLLKNLIAEEEKKEFYREVLK